MGSASPSRHCLSQQDCLCARGCYWKDLTRLGRDLAKTVALDHTIQGFPAQVPAALALMEGGVCVFVCTGPPREHPSCDGSSMASARPLSPGCQLDPGAEVGGGPAG